MKDGNMEIKDLIDIYPRLEAGESVCEPQNWAQCYHEDVTMLTKKVADLEREVERLRKYLQYCITDMWLIEVCQYLEGSAIQSAPDQKPTRTELLAENTKMRDLLKRYAPGVKV